VAYPTHIYLHDPKIQLETPRSKWINHVKEDMSQVDHQMSQDPPSVTESVLALTFLSFILHNEMTIHIDIHHFLINKETSYS
jgi:hypothetical protein